MQKGKECVILCLGNLDAEESIKLIILDEERLKWKKVRMRADDIAWIEEASKALEQEPIRLEFLEEALIAQQGRLLLGAGIGYDQRNFHQLRDAAPPKPLKFELRVIKVQKETEFTVKHVR